MQVAEELLEITLPYGYKPRKYQLNILKALDSGVKRAIWVAHRRSGKDITIFNWCVKKAFEERCTIYYIVPTYAQGRKILWDNLTIDGRKMLNFIPDKLIKRQNQQEMLIEFINGSIFQIVSAENPDSIIGSNAKVFVFSEYAIINKQCWDYARPILRINKGWAIFISTPRGKNHFWEMTQIAKDNPDKWFFETLSVEDTGVLTKEDIEDEKRAGMSDELIQQEYYVSFERGVEGAYYGKLIDKMRQEKRICSVPYEQSSNVNTAWDIGYGDSTAIIFWQQIGGETRIIDFYEAQGEGIAHYAALLQSKPYVYGTHYFPHDAGAGSIHTGQSLQQVARKLGINSVVLPREDISVGIESSRALLTSCFIDAEKCKHLIKCLENYHKKFNEKMNCYSDTPVHDWTSHACDSFRYMSRAKSTQALQGSLSPDQIREWRLKNLGY